METYYVARVMTSGMVKTFGDFNPKKGVENGQSAAKS
jgi:hypothetical protein